METEDSRQFNRFEIQGNNDSPWFKKHTKTLLIVTAISLIALLVIVIVLSVKCMSCAETAESKYQRNSQQLVWNEVCAQNSSECPASFHNNFPLLIISLDGFRADYLTRDISPTLSRIAECGVKADFMYPIYPSKTFPNHYTLVTGLYPSSHGIIDNTMYDTKLKKLFKVGKTPLDDPRWWQKEPIWVTAQKQGKRAASFFWPGSDVKINGSYPNLYRPYDGSVPFETRVDQVVEWLSSPTKPDFITLYFDEPDRAGHRYGPLSDEVNIAIQRVDSLVNRLLAGLQVRKLSNCVNVIIVSDHGMSEVDCSRTLDVRKYVNISKVYSFQGSFGRVKPKENTTSVDETVSKFRCQDSHLRAYRKEELPVRMHYVDNPRIEPIILEIDARYQLIDQDIKPGAFKCMGGNHGFDYIFSDMRAIFLAQGPAFKKSVSVKPFLNIELYELMCEIIGIKPQPNNGTKGSLHEVLEKPRELAPQKFLPFPQIAENPESSQSIQQRLVSSNCSCLQAPKQEISGHMIENKTRFHLPFGIPQTSEENDDVFLLYNNDYIVAYDKDNHFPRWTGFTVTHLKSSLELEICWSGDPRVENSSCSSTPEGFVLRPLYPPEFSDISLQMEAFYVTNSILKSAYHTSFLERKMNELLKNKASEVGPLNVMTGPAFYDFIETGNQRLSSPQTPTHIFIVLTWCSTAVHSLNECDPTLLDVQSFLLPNYPFSDNCQTAEDVIKKNAARVVDIEGATNITFYTELTTYNAVRLRTSVSF